MSHELTQEEIKHHVKIYISVFIALAVLTVVTVGISYLRLPLLIGVTVALIIATIKGSLVATYFMHLRTEKKIIFVILALAVVFFFALLLWPTWTSATRPLAL